MNWLGAMVAYRIRPTDDILDLGCGILQQFGGVPPLCRSYTGVDGYRPYLDQVAGVITAVHGVLPGVCAAFPDDSADVVLLLDVIEHINKEEGALLLLESKRISRRDVIVYTPEGFRENDLREAWGLGENHLQDHLSGWDIGELQQLGFVVIVAALSEGPGLFCRLKK